MREGDGAYGTIRARTRGHTHTHTHAHTARPTQDDVIDDEGSGDFQSNDSLADFEINHDELVYGECAGSGSFGTVYKGYWHGPVAIKKLNFREPSEQQLSDFRNEVAVLMYVEEGRGARKPPKVHRPLQSRRIACTRPNSLGCLHAHSSLAFAHEINPFYSLCDLHAHSSTNLC